MKSSPELSQWSDFAPLLSWLRSRTGLTLSDLDLDRLGQWLSTRATRSYGGDRSAYVRWLMRREPDSQTEWQRLLAALVNSETYFFRDHGQMSLLSEVILPRLLDQVSPGGRLRLWSAGCSTGEEAYSLAILVCEALSQRGRSLTSLNLEILGTDLNVLSLSRARTAIYGPWSFRDCDPLRRARYFQTVAGGEQPQAIIRSLVKFQPFNLVTDSVEQLGKFDLILCRNVFIYFEPAAIAATLAKFWQAVSTTGYLVTGHAELLGQTLEHWTTHNFAQTSVYQPRLRSIADGGPDPQHHRATDYRSTDHRATDPYRSTDQHATDQHSPEPRSLDYLSRWSGPRIDPARYGASTEATPIAPFPFGTVPPPVVPGPTRPPLTTPVTSGLAEPPLSGPTLGQTSTKPEPPSWTFTTTVPESIAPAEAAPAVSAETAIDQARSLAAADQPQAAIDLLEQWLDRSANGQAANSQAANSPAANSPAKEAAGLELLAMILADVGQHGAALRRAEAALALEPTSPRLCCLVARIYEDMGDLALAKKWLKRALYLDAQMIEALMGLGAIYANEGHTGRSRRIYDSARRLLLAAPGPMLAWHGGERPIAALLTEIDRICPSP